MTLRYRVLFSALLVMILILSGCGRRNAEPTPEPPAAAPLAAATDTPVPPTPEPEPTEAPAEEAAPAEEPAEPSSEEEAAAPAVDEAVFNAVNDYLTAIPEGYMNVGQIDALKEILDTGEAVVIDVREESDYAEGHIPGAINIPIRTVAQSLDLIPTDKPVLVYCASGLRAGYATTALRTLGYSNVRAFAPGWKGWSEAEEPVETDPVSGETYDVPELDAQVLAAVDGFLANLPEGFYNVSDVEKLEAALDAGAALVDVREPNEVAEGAIPGALNIPIRELAARAGEVPADQQTIAYCATGFRAGLSAAALHILGIEGVRVFAPGYGAWEAANEASGDVPAEVEAAVESDFDVAAGVGEFLSAIPEGYYAVGQIDAFKDALENTDIYLIDVREENEYAEGHIPGAVNIPMRSLADNLDQVSADQPVFLYCSSGHRAGVSLAALGMLGYTNVKSFPPGWKGWTAAEEEVSTEATEPGSFDAPEVDPEMLAAVAEFLNNIPEGYLSVGEVDKFTAAMDAGAFVIDVREENEYDAGHIPGAVNIPMRTLADNLDQIPTDQPVVTYCATGHRAAISMAALQTMGLSGARSFPAGYGAWEAAGETVEAGQ